jgi:prepilin peptidase CpaA
MGVALLAAGAWSGLAIAWDVRRRRIPNWLTLGAAGAALLCFGTSGRGPLGAPWPTSAAAGIGVAVAGTLLFARGRLGAGDVKFMAALPLVGGAESALRAFALGSGLLLAWVCARGCAARGREPRRAETAGGASGPPRAGTGIPLALPFGLGFLAELARLA